MSQESKSDATPAFVRLISAEKHTFIVERRVALQSATLRSMLTAGGFAEASGDVNLPEIHTPTLELVVEYLIYKLKYHNSKVPIPEFVIPPEAALDLIVAANYLDC